MMAAFPPFEIRPFTPDRLDELLALVNQAIAGRREAVTVTPEAFTRRVLDHPGFDPSGLLLAVSPDGALLGAAHALVPPLHIAHYARLAGQGFIFGPYVSGAARGQGVGRALLAEAEGWLSARAEVALMHGLRSPFYHTQEGPRQPYCGSTEVMGLTADDHALLAFLHDAGYQPIEEREVSMSALLRPLEVPDRIPADLRVVRVTPDRPWPGPVAWVVGCAGGYGYDRYRPMAAYDTYALAHGETIVGHCQWYPMRRVGRAALFDLRVDPSFRGRGLGRLVLHGALAAMAESGYREAELHTSPQRNTVAYAMYLHYGFREVAEWVMLRKPLR